MRTSCCSWLPMLSVTLLMLCAGPSRGAHDLDATGFAGMKIGAPVKSFPGDLALVTTQQGPGGYQVLSSENARLQFGSVQLREVSVEVKKGRITSFIFVTAGLGAPELDALKSALVSTYGPPGTKGDSLRWVGNKTVLDWYPGGISLRENKRSRPPAP